MYNEAFFLLCYIKWEVGGGGLGGWERKYRESKQFPYLTNSNNKNIL